MTAGIVALAVALLIACGYIIRLVLRYRRLDNIYGALFEEKYDLTLELAAVTVVERLAREDSRLAERTTDSFYGHYAQMRSREVARNDLIVKMGYALRDLDTVREVIRGQEHPEKPSAGEAGS